MFRSIWVIAKNTFREVIRDRILYGILIFALLLMGLSLALGNLSFAEQNRISLNFGFAGIQISAAVVAIFIGSSLVAKEIEKQTILTLLARPISRLQFLLGKFLGLSLVIVLITAGLAGVLAMLSLVLDFRLDAAFAVALYGIFLEAMLLLAFAIFFGSFARPTMTVMFSISVYLLGHWVDNLPFFVQRSHDQKFKFIGGVIEKIFPNLERFNWRAIPVYSEEVPWGNVGWSSLYALIWLSFLIVFTHTIFRRRDFV